MLLKDLIAPDCCVNIFWKCFQRRKIVQQCKVPSSVLSLHWNGSVGEIPIQNSHLSFFAISYKKIIFSFQMNTLFEHFVLHISASIEQTFFSWPLRLSSKKKVLFFNCQFFSFGNLWHPVFLSDHIKIKKVSWRNPSSNVQRRIFFRYNIHLTRKIPWGLE